MIWYFIWPAPHPKYVHPPGTNINFSHLRVNPEFRQNFFKNPYVPDGCMYRSTLLGREDLLSQVSFDIVLSKKKFGKRLQQNQNRHCFCNVALSGKISLKVFLHLHSKGTDIVIWSNHALYEFRVFSCSSKGKHAESKNFLVFACEEISQLLSHC